MITTTPAPRDDALARCSGPQPGLDTATAEWLAHACKALGDPTRVRLLSLVASHADTEACVCHLTKPVGLSQPTVSHHLKQLVDAGLLTRQQRGRWSHYRVADGAIAAVATILERLAPPAESGPWQEPGRQQPAC